MKPLGHKSYTSIGHLPGSRLGPSDSCINAAQSRICTVATRDKHDTIIVEEKLDGSNVAVCNIDGAIVAVGRAGHLAASSPYEQHRIFAEWVLLNERMFDFLKPGERVCGEWLAQAHGTRYKLSHLPFVPFDIMHSGHTRCTHAEVNDRAGTRFVRPTLLAMGPTSIDKAMEILGEHGHHGAIDPAEGAVWRVERNGKVDFLAKYVRPGKVDGKYLPEISGQAAVWNWHIRQEARA